MTNINSLAEQIIFKTDGLKSNRVNFERLWQEVSELVLPRKADFSVVQSAGAKRTRKLFETTAVNSAELLAAGLHGMMTNPSGKWFSLSISNGEAYPDIALWLEKAEGIIAEEIARPAAGFATNIHEVFLDIAVLGTAGLYVGWNEDQNSLLFQSRFLAELFIEENTTGLIDSIYRLFRMPVSKIVQTWGIEVLPENIRFQYVQNSHEDAECEIIHAILPNHSYKKGDLFQKPISSVYVLKSAKTILHSSGFDEMPLFVTRWSKASAETYGRSPAISALPDIKMLQEMMKETIISAQLANRPPLLVKDDDQFAPIATVPGGIIRYSGEAPKAFSSGANSSIGLEMMNEIRKRIRLAFYNDQLMTNNEAQMTATEVVYRNEEKMRLLGPVFGRLQTELLGPMIRRIFGLLLRHGKIPPLPGGIKFEDLKVEYLSPLILVQKQVEAQAISQTLALSEAVLRVRPDAAAIFKAGEIIRKIGKVYGVSETIFNSDEEIMLIRQEAEDVE